ncbi:MAG: 16S rRNA (cytosine(1402)-N(4))-methyltransferase RsmH [Actinomycetota bacterium]
MGEKVEHVSVLLERCVELLAPAIERVENPVVVDATLGLGGHTEALLTKYTNLTVIGIDRDLEALTKARERLSIFGNRFRSEHAIYDDILLCIENQGFTRVQGILFDLGISSLQIDQNERGFSYSIDAPLDMRMDRSQGQTAADLVNFGTRHELISILRNFGDEKFAPRIVDALIKARAIAPLNSTLQLAEIVKNNIPAATRRTGGNPSKRTFQALRIAVNDELGALTRAIPLALEALAVGGRVVVMSFQSLEDKIVKSYFSTAVESKAPRNLPYELTQFAPKFTLVVKQSETASAEEEAINPRSHSVRLRAIERVAA